MDIKVADQWINTIFRNTHTCTACTLVSFDTKCLVSVVATILIPFGNTEFEFCCFCVRLIKPIATLYIWVMTLYVWDCPHAHICHSLCACSAVFVLSLTCVYLISVASAEQWSVEAETRTRSRCQCLENQWIFLNTLPLNKSAGRVWKRPAALMGRNDGELTSHFTSALKGKCDNSGISITTRNAQKYRNKKLSKNLSDIT